MIICPKCHFRNGESGILCADCGELLDCQSPGTIVEAPPTLPPAEFRVFNSIVGASDQSTYPTRSSGHGLATPVTLQPNELRGMATLKPDDHYNLRADLGVSSIKTALPVSPEASQPLSERAPVAPSRLAAVAESVTLSPTPQVRAVLVVLRGERVSTQYPIYPGENFIGRTDDKPVDIDLENQEPPERIWTSRQHAVIQFENGALTIQDLNSLNGTFVNRSRVHPGQVRQLQANDIIQLGTVQMRVVIGS